LDDTELKGIYERKAVAVQSQLQVAWIFSMIEELCEKSTASEDFRFQLTGFSQQIVAAKKFKVGELKLFPLTDSLSKISKIASTDNTSIVLATCKGVQYSISQPAGFKPDDLKDDKKKDSRAVIPFWWVKPATADQDVNMHLSEVKASFWAASVWCLTNSEALKPNDVLLMKPASSSSSGNKRAKKS